MPVHLIGARRQRLFQWHNQPGVVFFIPLSGTGFHHLLLRVGHHNAAKCRLNTFGEVQRKGLRGRYLSIGRRGLLFEMRMCQNGGRHCRRDQ